MSTAEGGGNIVTDGLVLYLDAANKRSYPGTGTVWSDLSRGGNNGTLSPTISGPTFDGSNGGCIVFDGTNDFCNLGKILNYTSENFTFSYWVYFNSLTTNVVGQGPIVLWKGSYQSMGYYDQIGTNGNITFVTNQPGAAQGTTTNNNMVLANTWCNISYVRNGSSVRIYYNGIDSNSTSPAHINPSSAPSNNFNIAVYQNNFIWGNFRLAQFMNYNRALSATEILQNYNTTKSRLGL